MLSEGHLLTKGNRSDNVDGDTSRVVVAGVAVNVNTAGTYVITYNVSDAAGNAATSYKISNSCSR
jgi:hypothetical protein